MGGDRAEQTKTPQCPLAHTGTAVPQGGGLGVTSSASLALGYLTPPSTQVYSPTCTLPRLLNRGKIQDRDILSWSPKLRVAPTQDAAMPVRQHRRPALPQAPRPEVLETWSLPHSFCSEARLACQLLYLSSVPARCERSHVPYTSTTAADERGPHWVFQKIQPLHGSPCLWG